MPRVYAVFCFTHAADYDEDYVEFVTQFTVYYRSMKHAQESQATWYQDVISRMPEDCNIESYEQLQVVDRGTGTPPPKYAGRFTIDLRK